MYLDPSSLTAIQGGPMWGRREDLVALSVELDLDGQVRWADPTTRQLLGREETEEFDWFERTLSAEDAAIHREHFAALVQSGTDAPRLFETQLRDNDGAQWLVQWHAVARRDRSGQVRGISLIGALLASGSGAPGAALEQLLDLRYALDQACIVAATDRKGVITYVNDTFCLISGYSREELVGRTHAVVNSGHHPREFFKAMWATIGRGEVWRGEICNRARDGRLYWVSTTIVPFVDREGRPYRYLAIRYEITAHKEAEAALARTVAELEEANRRIIEEQSRMLQAEKLSSVGLLAAGVAHEINNPLAGTMACVKQLRDGRVAEHRRDTYFETVLDGLDRIRNIVQALLDYARPTAADRHRVDAAEVVDGCLLLVRPALHKQRVVVDHQRPAAPVYVEGDRRQLMQAAMNVLLNAVHATPAGGTITVDHPVDGERVAIRVADQGPGIPPEHLARVCDPFFTTKPEGTGTGLGLSVTLGIVQAHGGELRFGSGAKGGAVITMWLPAA